MDISQLSTSVLENLIKISKKRDALVAELKKVESSLSATYAGTKPAPQPKVQTRRQAVRIKAKTSDGKSGALKTRILAALRAAGNKGIRVKVLAQDLGVKNANVHVWFGTTGKKIAAIQRIGPGCYRLKA